MSSRGCPEQPSGWGHWSSVWPRLPSIQRRYCGAYCSLGLPQLGQVERREERGGQVERREGGKGSG